MNELVGGHLTPFTLGLLARGLIAQPRGHLSDGASAFLQDCADEKRGARLAETRERPPDHRRIAYHEKTDHRPRGGHQSGMTRENVSRADALRETIFELLEVVIEPLAGLMKGLSDLPRRASSRGFHF